MKTLTPLVSVLGLSLFFSGCVGSGPNTQQGAVAGGALGALAGAIIGNNSGGGNALAGAVIGGAAGAIAGGTIGNSLDQQRGTLYRTEAEATTTVVVRQPPPMPAPPPPQVVVVERPMQPAGAVWIEGHYVYDGRGYVWLGGHWLVPPQGCRAYVQPHWVRRGRSHNWVYVQGYWR